MLKSSSTILFQGDSITDCGRSRDDSNANSLGALGMGYAKMVPAQLLAQRPADNLKFYNRGISGNRIVDLYARIKSDVINLKPDIMSVLIGVNDTWHEFGSRNGVPVPKYERVYREFLTEVREALPGIQFVLCEPFVLKCGVVNADWVAEMDQRRAVVKKLADEFGAVFVPFQTMFDKAVTQAAPEYWAGDGVHPSAAGHYLMAQEWLAAVE
ncbi:MAG: SGNH/GDSL hydrolase family protein [Chthoniobacteraceae bacterium]